MPTVVVNESLVKLGPVVVVVELVVVDVVVVGGAVLEVVVVGAAVVEVVRAGVVYARVYDLRGRSLSTLLEVSNPRHRPFAAAKLGLR